MSTTFRLAAWLMASFLTLFAIFLLSIPSADAADLYYVGSTDNWAATTSWKIGASTGSCNDGGDAAAAPTSADNVYFTSDCTQGVTVPASTTITTLQTGAGYTGTITQAGALDATGNFVISSGSTVDSAGFDLTVGGQWTNLGTYTSGSNTVTFDGTSGSQLVTSGGTTTAKDFNNVVIANTGSGTTLDTNAIDIDGTLTINSGSTFYTNSLDLTVVGTFSNNGTLQMTGNETITFTAGMDSDSGQVNFFDSGGGSRNLNGLTSFFTVVFIDGGSGATWTMAANIDVENMLYVVGGALATGGNDINIAGTFQNDDTFTHGNGTVTFDGTSTQTITGDTTFYDVVAAASSARTLVLTSGDTMTVANSLSLNGASGSLLSIQATTAGSAATIAASGATESTSFLSLKDVTLTGQVILCDPGCINRGGNPGWIIPAEDSELPGLSSVQVTSPNGGERWLAGATTDITWDLRHDDVETVTIYLSDDGGDTWTAIAEDLQDSGSYMYTVPSVSTMKALVRVTGYDANGTARLYDLSDRTFVIEAAEDVGTTEEGSDQSPEDTDLTFTEVLMTRVDGTQASLAPGGLFRGETLSGVYLINDDGTRSVFPHASVFESYGYSFDDVVMVQDDQLQKLELGGRVTMAPGRMIKIQSDNRVFQVQDDGTISHIPDEATAIALYGETWNQQITDVSVTFWGDYPLGEALASL